MCEAAIPGGFGTELLQQRSRQFAPIVERGLLTYRSGGGFTDFANFVDDFGGSVAVRGETSEARPTIPNSSGRHTSGRTAGV
jgi:hypothetical protein